MGPGGPRRSVESYEILSFVDFKKKVSKSTTAIHPVCALKRGILRGNRHMWAPPLYHFVWDFSLLCWNILILKGGATSLELVSYISVLYFANLCTS